MKDKDFEFITKSEIAKIIVDACMFIGIIIIFCFLFAIVADAQELPCDGKCGPQIVTIDQSRFNYTNRYDTSTDDHSVNATSGDSSSYAQGGLGGNSNQSQTSAGGNSDQSQTAAGGSSDQSQTASAGSHADGGSVGSIDASDRSSNRNESNFLSLNLALVQASGCFGGWNAGGGADNKAGFLGLSWLNNDCWMDHVASLERDAMINARLKCGAKRYRKAIAFDQPRRERQQYCVDTVYAANLALIDHEKQQIETAVDVIENQCMASEEALARCESNLFGGK